MGGVILIGVLADQQFGVFRERRRIVESVRKSAGPPVSTN
jgi:ribose transport system permease protein